MYRKSNEETLGEVIQRLIKAYRIEPGLNKATIVKRWHDNMGSLISKRTESIFMKRTTLYVRLNSAPLKNELVMGKSKILEMLNEGFSEEVVKEIVFL